MDFESDYYSLEHARYIAGLTRRKNMNIALDFESIKQLIKRKIVLTPINKSSENRSHSKKSFKPRRTIKRFNRRVLRLYPVKDLDEINKICTDAQTSISKEVKEISNSRKQLKNKIEKHENYFEEIRQNSFLMELPESLSYIKSESSISSPLSIEDFSFEEKPEIVYRREKAEKIFRKNQKFRRVYNFGACSNVRLRK